MANWLMNSAVLTAYGDFNYSPITCDEARRKVRESAFGSAIGHSATAKVLSEQQGIEVPLNRIQITMVPGDRAIIFRLRDRLPEYAVLSKVELMTLPSEFGLLTRVE